MALVIHMTVEGDSQGTITEGCSFQVGREDTTQIVALKQPIDMPQDEASGRIAGRRIHGPLTSTKELDRSSPMLQQALARSENLTVTYNFYRFDPAGTGKEEQFYTIVLNRARLVGYEAELPFVLDRDTANYPPLEHLKFTYQSIEAEFKGENPTAFADDWREPDVS